MASLHTQGLPASSPEAEVPVVQRRGRSKGNDLHSRHTQILVVEDDPSSLRLVTRILTHQGYRVGTASNGSQALDAVLSFPPDLILLDIMMPGMDGYEVCQRLRAEEKTRDTPILFISALDSIEDKVTAFDAGGVDYVTKPVQAEELLARVATHLRLRALQQELREEVAELDAFAHTVAHDLKNPLGYLISYVDYLFTYAPRLSSAERAEALRSTRGLARDAVNIVDELLLLACVRRGAMDLIPVDTEAVVKRSLQRLESMIEEYQGEITLPTVWPIALGYAPWIEEVWTNYLSNGLKYGGRPPRLELGATPQPCGSIRFWTQDNGEGLTPAEQAELFTEFTRIADVRVEGHGLGLSIVRRIVEKLGGEVGVESEKGQGSTFWFQLTEWRHSLTE